MHVQYMFPGKALVSKGLQPDRQSMMGEKGCRMAALLNPDTSVLIQKRHLLH